MSKKNFIPLVLWLLIITWIFSIDRADFTILWGAYSLAFVMYIWLVFGKHALSLKTGLLIAALARLVSFFFEPMLSDDYFRFIWDGMLICEGIHPMAYTPAFIIDHPELLSPPMNLFQGLNSPDYYSVYPPLAQGIFGLIYFLSGPEISTNIIFYKLVLLFSDITICFLLIKLLRLRKLPSEGVLIYALNPLIIVEFMGNLHMDGLMIAGLLGAVLLSSGKHFAGSMFMMVCSLMAKFLTLILIPFMPKTLYWKKMLLFSGFTLFLSGLILWWSFGSMTGWVSSIGLWFQTFEFNASFYYLFRYLGYLLKGYNTIEFLGPAMAFVFVLGAILIWVKYLYSTAMDWSQAMLFVLTLFFLCSTTVHPWYIGTLLVLGILSQWRYPLVWTYLVVLSYSHYDGNGYSENYWLIAVEYILLAGFIIWEYRRRHQMALARRHKKTLA